MFTLQFLGGGRMAEALLCGLLRDDTLAASDIAVCEVSEQRREQLERLFPDATILDEPVACVGAVVATKPNDVGAALAALDRVGVQRVLSIAAGVSIQSLQAELSHDVAVIRAMPNTPALVGAGASAIAAGPSATPGDVDWAQELLASVGTVVKVPETSLDAVTGLSGSGPAYVFLVAEALIEAGVLAGLPRSTADDLVRQTLLGAARLLAESDDDPAALRAGVTSPGGTTAAGLRVLEERAVRSAFLDAVAAAAERSRQLGA